MENQNNIVLEMKGISKRFPGVLALDNVDFSLSAGKVHALMGENGAGKSTLMKALAGIQPADEGEIIYKGKKVNFQTPRQALDNGIAMIHQEISPILDMSITENLFLGKEYRNRKNRMVDFKRMEKEASELLKRVGLKLNPKTLMRNLTVSQMQMVEIAKAISYDSEIIIMDEPSSSITIRETENLFKIIAQLKSEGRCIVYISHKIDEVLKIADEITVFRDGHYIETCDAKGIDEKQLVKLMVNRDLDKIYPQRKSNIGEVKLKVENLSRQGSFSNVSFELHKGEILGLAGLIGAGRTEVADTIFGVTKPTGGCIYINNEKVVNPTPKYMSLKRVGYVTEDRKATGLVLGMSIQDNCIVTSLKRLSTKTGRIKDKLAISESDKYIDKLKIKTSSRERMVKELSGGNQQKVVLAKWLMTNPEVIIFDEPTRGIDIGAKSEIYRLIAKLAEQGTAIIFISSEMPEILGMCDRIVVLNEGKVSGEVNGSEATQEKLFTLATGMAN